MTAATCPHCGKHPYEYIDVCRGAAKPEVVCCAKAQQDAVLPPLPEPGHWYFDGGESVPTDGYTSEQMQEYALAALAAQSDKGGGA